MPCCALAACIVGQLLLALGIVKSRLFGAAPAADENAAVEWSLGDPRAPTAASLRPRRAMAWLVAVEVAIVVATLVAVREHVGHESDGRHAVHAHESESPRR